MDDAIKSSVYVTSPEFAGYLDKKGFRWRKVWKKRWVALHGMEIVYMDKEPTSKNMSDINITKCQLTGASVVKEEDPDNDPTGFSIHINDGQSPTWHLRAEDERQRKLWVLRLSYALAIVKWLDDFEKVRVLGVGGTGIVYELLHKTNGKRFALKEMEMKSSYQMQMAVSEAEMLKDICENIDHPNVMHIERVFQVGAKFYLVFPLCFGGELYEHIIRRGHFTEHDAALITRDLVGGLNALHKHNIIHLDIKPENILFDSTQEDASIKITDFGLSKNFTEDEEAALDKNTINGALDQELRSYQLSGDLTNDRKMKGTIGYMSPELLLINHTSRAADVFAAGVVMYILLSGMPPFQGMNDRDTIGKTINGEINMKHEVWECISAEAKDLVKKMLAPNPFQRLTAEQVLAHPWLQQLDDGSSSSSASSSVAGEDKITPMNKVFSKNGPGKKRSGVNLAGTLRHLSGHVKQKRSEKLATNMTGKSTLADIYLVGKEEEAVKRAAEKINKKVGGSVAGTATASTTSSNFAASAPDDSEDYMMLMNTELREAFTKVITRLTASGNAGLLPPGSMERLSISATTDNLPSSSSGARGDDDGGLPGGQAGQQRRSKRAASETSAVQRARADAAAAVAAANANDVAGRESMLGLDRSLSIDHMGFTIEQFVTILAYLQFNSVNPGAAVVSSIKNHFGALVFSRYLDRDGDGFITLDDISTVQALMMQRSVGFVQMVFRIYSEVLWYPGRQLNIMNFINVTKTTNEDAAGEEASAAAGGAGAGGEAGDGSAANPSTPGGNSGTKKLSSIFSSSSKKAGDHPTPGTGGADRFRVLEASSGMPKDVVEPPKFITARHVAALFEKLGYDPACGTKVFGVLCEALTRVDGTVLETSSAGAGAGAGDGQDVGEEGGGARGTLTHRPSDLGGEGSGYRDSEMTVNALTAGSGASAASYKMDVKSFVRAAEIDDVLLQAIWRRPRSALRDLMQNARTKAEASGNTQSVAEIIEEDLLAVLEPAMQRSSEGGRRQPRGSNSSLGFGRNAMNSVLGLAGAVVGGASALTNEIMHGDD
eukprot:CAMPEP_0174996974 /NCGR_PEP_ID=MMETSP0005-20121125/696_1 /TAXON_ID=420556 /ORGANISM="Ochromonas sp., Strain CCMP1393" /LENGTH=1057 /DNA_ID=CAMNT_0016251449 /DNA_START=95 /DNA_END=3269 /DNA_ORIENTATION=-